jgi:glucose-1-phosphate thymidylyltransferase
VADSERYGVAEFDSSGKVLSIIEKPSEPKFNYVVKGLCFYLNSVINVAENVKPSHRGELEITNFNKHYLEQEELSLQVMSRGFAWCWILGRMMLLQREATEFVKAVEKRAGLKIACLEEVGVIMSYISIEKVRKNIKGLKGNYYSYLYKCFKSKCL